MHFCKTSNIQTGNLKFLHNYIIFMKYNSVYSINITSVVLSKKMTLERGRDGGGEREKGKHPCEKESSPLFGIQNNAPTEPHWPGQ